MKTTKIKGTSEASTLKAIMDYLDGQEILYIRIAQSSNVGPGRWRHIRVSQMGVPDLLVWRKHSMAYLGSEAIAVEVKAEKGTLRESQKAWAERAKQWGVPYHVVHSFSEFMEIGVATGKGHNCDCGEGKDDEQ